VTKQSDKVTLGKIAILLLILAACLPVLADAPSRVSVRDYGAKGNGVADDTAAFTFAMKAVAEHGGTAFVPDMSRRIWQCPQT
jgi:hypothetical protein